MKENKPKWLHKLQQNSWEPEILLSGIVLYGLFKLPGILDEMLYFFKVNFASSSTDIDNFVGLMKVAIYWVITGLILHLISRGIWVGMVGLSFTFPNGVNYDRIKLAPKYRAFLGKIPRSEKVILNLESFSSTLFSVSFMAFMIMIGAYLYLFLLIILPIVSLDLLGFGDFEGISDTVFTVYLIGVLIIGLIGFVDFVTLGFFKRFRWLSPVYWPLYRFFGFFTMARAYRAVYYTLVSNINKWKIAAFFLIFSVISFYWVGSSGDDAYPGDSMSQIDLWSNSMYTGAFTGYYDDQIDDKKSIHAQIQSDIIRGNTIRLFVVLHAEYEDSIRSYGNYDSLVQVDGKSNAMAKLECLSSFYKVSIGDSLYHDLVYRFHYKSQTQQKGILTYLDISDLPSGLHELQVRPPKGLVNRNIFAAIPFYKEEVLPSYVVPGGVGRDEEDEKDSYLKLKPILPK